MNIVRTLRREKWDFSTEMVFGNSGRGRHSGRGSGNGGCGSGRFGHRNNDNDENSGKSTADELKFIPFQDGKSTQINTHKGQGTCCQLFEKEM